MEMLPRPLSSTVCICLVSVCQLDLAGKCSAPLDLFQSQREDNGRFFKMFSSLGSEPSQRHSISCSPVTMTTPRMLVAKEHNLTCIRFFKQGRIESQAALSSRVLRDRLSFWCCACSRASHSVTFAVISPRSHFCQERLSRRLTGSVHSMVLVDPGVHAHLGCSVIRMSGISAHPSATH